MIQASTVKLGTRDGEDVFVPMSWMLPMVDPNDIEIDGWDISKMNLADAMQRSKVLDINLQKQLRQHMINMKPRKSIYSRDFIAANQVRKIPQRRTIKYELNKSFYCFISKFNLLFHFNFISPIK